MTPLRVLGVDPGETTGLFLLRSPGQPSAYQCDAGSAPMLAAWLVSCCAGPVILAGEAFQEGTGPGTRRSGAAVTRNLVTRLDALNLPYPWHWRGAGLVKPWSTNKRLLAAGLLEACHGMPHAADAARHALYAAVHDGGMADPSSLKKPFEKGYIVTGEDYRRP